MKPAGLTGFTKSLKHFQACRQSRCWAGVLAGAAVARSATALVLASLHWRLWCYRRDLTGNNEVCLLQADEEVNPNTLALGMRSGAAEGQAMSAIVAAAAAPSAARDFIATEVPRRLMPVSFRL